MISVLSLNCPVCGAPFSPGAERCGYCGSILVLQTDHPRIDPQALNRAVVDKHIAEYRDLLSTDPHSVKAHYGLGVAYFNLGLTEASIDALEKASSLTPENPHIHTQLAVAWREEAKSGNELAKDEMRDHIRYALRLDPKNVEALTLAAEMNGGFRPTATPFAAPMIDMDVAPRIEKVAPVVRSVLLAFLAGVGLFVVLCGILVTVVDPESGSAGSAFLGLILLALMSLPFILATRAWYKTRKKDQFS